jgi:transcriptional regulator with XRE-family HTH domain
VRRERETKGLSQERLAQEAGLSRQYVGMVERGERKPTLHACHALAKALGSPLSALVRDAERLSSRSA